MTTTQNPKKRPPIKVVLRKTPGKNEPPQGGNRFWANLITAALIFVVIIGLYAFVTNTGSGKEEIALSQLASDINGELVSRIVVEGDTLDIQYKDQSEKRSKKEEGTALSQTLVNYGVDQDKLTAVSVEIKTQSGFGFWILNLAPILIPILFIIFFIWYMTRQVRGAGMQAFTFGQSKARIILPDDKKQRVTFKDVAGVKEAKEELREIVDFLRNPKKFFDIGARIPKGVLLMGAPGTGKCVTGDTLILTNKGPIRIDEVPKYFSVKEDGTVEGLDIVGLDKKLIFNKTSASHWYDLGEQETLEIDTDMGVKIQGTYEHPVVVIERESGNFVFRRLDEVKEEDCLVVGYNNNVFGSYTKIPNEDVAYLMGVLVGDGGLTTKNRISFSTRDQELLDKVQDITRKTFDAEFRKTQSEYDYVLTDKEIKTDLLGWGLSETYSEGKSVPDWIKIAPKSYTVAFLRGLFDTDGYVEKNGAICLSSASPGLIKEVHNILLNCGIVARLYERTKLYNNKKQYYLSIYGDFVETYSREIGFVIKHKANRLQVMCERQRNTNINTIPFQGQTIKYVWKEALSSTDKVLDRAFYGRSLYKNVKQYANGSRSPSLAGVNTFIAGATDLSPQVMDLPEMAYLKRISSGQFFFTKVKSIRQDRNRVFDLTVPVIHNFIANGLINHNTLLARAVAGEAGVSFFSISGSEFVEMFVGVGASRVRDLFKLAKQAAPAIIFVDEIDAVGRVRGAGPGGGNDEREQTLNQILVEMDGFEPTEKVIVMAATNRPDVLDPALLRPGRFDRRVVLDLPDRSDREEILTIHARSKALAEDVNLKVIAERTPGFSGADLYSLMNEGAILAARENRTKVFQYDLIRSIEKVMLGPERKSHLLSKKEKEITAYHEAGHALVASVLPYADPVHKISIISRGRAAGYTLKLPTEERKLQSNREFLADIAVSLGGYVVEKSVFGDLTTGSSSDLQVATALARDMVTKYGMSEKIGPVALESGGGRIVFGRGLMTDREYSEKIGAEIDAEVAKIMAEAFAKATQIITKHKKALKAIATKLIEVETIERDDFEKILVANGIIPKKKKDIEHQK